MRWSAPAALAVLLLPSSFSDRDETSLKVSSPSRVLRGTIGSRSTLGGTLQAWLPLSAIKGLVDASRPLYDLKSVGIGHPWALVLTPDGLLRAFTYGIDELRTLRIVRRNEALEAEVVERSSRLEMALVSGLIRSSLLAAVSEEGEKDELGLALAEIFAWDIDFHKEIQRGDSFRVAVEKLTVDGHFARYGRIVAAEFTRGSRILQAVRFEGSDGAGYYAPDGTPLRKQFLRSPLKFTRITSRFSHARFHPILQAFTPHLGVDYAAPVGTPVLASADGIVAQAGWAGGFGQLVRLRHANGYETLYGHLSRINVRGGQRVSQGFVLGAVGTTGLSTGPHLDYRICRYGTFLNPLTVNSPPASPVPPQEREAFERAREVSLALLGRSYPPPRASAKRL